MKRWLSPLVAGLCLLLLPVLPLSARTATPPAPAPPVPLLWEVKGQGDARLLLLGSFHLLMPGDYPLSSDVEKAYRRAGRLVFELGPVEMGSPALAGQLMQSALRTVGSRLQAELDGERWSRLQAWSAQRAMPLASLQGLQTWFVALTVNLHGLAEAGMQADLGLDRHLMQRAVGDGKAVQGLEAADAQFALLKDMEAPLQLQMLDDALEDADAGGRQLRELHAAWRRGDAAALWQGAGESMRQQTPTLYQRINVARNEQWLAQLPAWLQAGQGTTLMVVGAPHLLGEDGLVARLQSQGLTVQRVCTVAGCPGKRTRRG